MRRELTDSEVSVHRWLSLSLWAPGGRASWGKGPEEESGSVHGDVGRQGWG